MQNRQKKVQVIRGKKKEKDKTTHTIFFCSQTPYYISSFFSVVPIYGSLRITVMKTIPGMLSCFHYCFEIRMKFNLLNFIRNRIDEIFSSCISSIKHWPIPNSGNQMSYFYGCKFGNARNCFYFFLSVSNLLSLIVEFEKQMRLHKDMDFFSPR